MTNRERACCAHRHIEWWQNSETTVTACGWKCTDCGTAFYPKPFVDAVVSEERERCAKIADRLTQLESTSGPLFVAGVCMTAMQIAEEIRAGQSENPQGPAAPEEQ